MTETGYDRALTPGIFPATGAGAGRLWRRPLVALALTAVLSACGRTTDSPSASSASSASSADTGASTESTEGDAASGPPATGEATDTDLCTLISKEEAEEAVGASVQDGQSTAENQVLGLVGSCIYQGTDSSQGATVVNLIVLGTTVPREVFDSEIVNDMADGAPVSGLGEVAYAIAGLATVFDQGLVLTLQILNQLVPADAAVITDLLATALDRADALR